MKFDDESDVFARNRKALSIWLRTDYGPVEGGRRLNDVEEIIHRLKRADRFTEREACTTFEVLVRAKSGAVNARIRSNHRDHRERFEDFRKRASRYVRWRQTLLRDLRLDGEDDVIVRIEAVLDAMTADVLATVLSGRQKSGGRPAKEWTTKARHDLTAIKVARRDQDDLLEAIGLTDKYRPRRLR